MDLVRPTILLAYYVTCAHLDDRVNRDPGGQHEQLPLPGEVVPVVHEVWLEVLGDIHPDLLAPGRGFVLRGVRVDREHAGDEGDV